MEFWAVFILPFRLLNLGLGKGFGFKVMYIHVDVRTYFFIRRGTSEFDCFIV